MPNPQYRTAKIKNLIAAFQRFGWPQKKARPLGHRTQCAQEHSPAQPETRNPNSETRNNSETRKREFGAGCKQLGTVVVQSTYWLNGFATDPFNMNSWPVWTSPAGSAM